MEFFQELFGTILIALAAFLAAGVILTLVTAVLGWSLYKARRRIDQLAARATSLATTLAFKTPSPQEDESAWEPGPAGSERTEPRRPFRFRDHPILTIALVAGLFMIFFAGLLIPFLLLAAFPVVPVVLGVLRYRAQRRIRALTARITAMEAELAAGSPSPTATPVAVPSSPAAAMATEVPVEATEEVAKPDREPDSAKPAWTDALHSFLFGGNTLTRVGIILLFFGFAFFLSYAAEQGWFSIQLRLGVAAAAGVALLTLGWLLRDLRREYALALQGGGAGIAYLTAFAAVSFYDVIGPAAGLSAMVLLVAVTGALALRQDAPSLALLSSLGGFLGPVLVTRDASHVALFSYYAVLDVGIVAVAWFRAWRLLSLLGFVFTFLVGGSWGAAYYQPQYSPCCGPGSIGRTWRTRHCSCFPRWSS